MSPYSRTLFHLQPSDQLPEVSTASSTTSCNGSNIYNNYNYFYNCGTFCARRLRPLVLSVTDKQTEALALCSYRHLQRRHRFQLAFDDFSIPSASSTSFNKEEEPLGLAGFEQLPRAKPDSSSPVGFGKEEDLVLAQSTHIVGEPD